MNYHHLRAWHGMPREEFVEQLRLAAINTNVPPMVIAAIDALREPDDILKHPDVVEAVEDARYYGAADMRDAAVSALEGALPGFGLTRKQIREIVGAVERLRPS